MTKNENASNHKFSDNGQNKIVESMNGKTPNAEEKRNSHESSSTLEHQHTAQNQSKIRELEIDAAEKGTKMVN